MDPRSNVRRRSLGVFKVVLKKKKKSLLLPSECLSAKKFQKNLMSNYCEILDPKISHSLKAQKVTFTLCHQVEFQKSLMNRFREYFKCIYFGPK